MIDLKLELHGESKKKIQDEGEREGERGSEGGRVRGDFLEEGHCGWGYEG